MVHSWVAALVKTGSDLGSLSWLSHNLDFFANTPLVPFLLVSCNPLDSLSDKYNTVPEIILHSGSPQSVFSGFVRSLQLWNPTLIFDKHFQKARLCLDVTQAHWKALEGDVTWLLAQMLQARSGKAPCEPAFPDSCSPGELARRESCLIALSYSIYFCCHLAVLLLESCYLHPWSKTKARYSYYKYFQPSTKHLKAEFSVVIWSFVSDFD